MNNKYSKEDGVVLFNEECAKNRQQLGKTTP